MKIRVTQTIYVNDEYREAINQFYGREGLATREQVKRWIIAYGDSMDGDLADRVDDDTRATRRVDYDE